jgi:aryl-alcohol dehydrogenase-like predicted oxidoreductase
MGGAVVRRCGEHVLKGFGMEDRITRRQFLRSASLAAGAVVGSSILGTIASSALAGKPQNELPKLPRRPLGKTGLEVSIIGLGGDGVISDTTNDDTAIEFITAAMDAGINFVDTAYLYGKDGRCDRNLGLVLGTKRRKDVIVATKTGARQYDSAMRQIETSMKRLRVDRLDLVQVHHVSEKDDLKQIGSARGVLAAVNKLRDQKVVRFVGLTGHPDSPKVLQAIQMYDWDSVMCFVNPARFSRPALEGQIPEAVKKEMGVIGMKAMGGRPGKLVGNGEGKAGAQTLLRYALSQKVSTVLLGMASMAQLQQNITIARNFKPLTPEETAELTRVINAPAQGWKR